MAEKISDLSGDEREQRIAELKRKMQESAKRNRAASGERASLRSRRPLRLLRR